MDSFHRALQRGSDRDGVEVRMRCWSREGRIEYMGVSWHWYESTSDPEYVSNSFTSPRCVPSRI